MNDLLRKIKRYLGILNEQRRANNKRVENILYCPCDYKSGHTPPLIEDFMPFLKEDFWGNGVDSHVWFYFTVTIPEEMKKLPAVLQIITDKSGWDAGNPQFIAYVNGVLRQGLDTNHTTIFLDGADTFEIYLYAYTGPKNDKVKFNASYCNINQEVEQLYYDIKVPLDMLDYLETTSEEYVNILCHLNNALSKLNLLELPSDAFFESVKDAKAYMNGEFYGKYCRKQHSTTICIGHTHIDCAWLWTLKQTREKVQRSFATVIELMKRYPEYKFMSSQAFLYQNLKEESPELYEEVRQMIKAGRWECEGAMWVEADCNLSSGESLIRQIVYGKRFFMQEFGVDNKVLWLPDVFGYSAAMPQILKKTGINWFVTSKISWNDTNLMPYDTFVWKGIDGTEINTYFLTAQDRKRGGSFDQRSTYNGHTGAKMIAGTWNRYQQKQLNDEALLTFGFGDGGGGPTIDHLEYARRTEKGIPGAPNSKIDFAGAFLSRLEKKIENNPYLPKWHGELYLEFHRGTYTTLAKNKRNNRKSEFLYLDTEFVCSLAKKLVLHEFDCENLHKGWKNILVNQFHDILPGSSIKEVYDQCDIDYKMIKEIAETELQKAKTAIISNLAANDGYVVFNPHSFVGDGIVRIDGKTAYVKGIPSKGYRVIHEYKQTNEISVTNGTRVVKTAFFIVEFDENMQMISLFDRKNEREILKKGTIGNEIQIYEDYPDAYDAWEWQAYSTTKYTVLTALESVQVVDDGARKGIKIIRPHMHSKITQTIWFYDDIGKIDFDTIADWQEKHQMVKAAFALDINADKATYEIQFGTTERPTHKNTSWDAMKFEVCGQKYADISDGSYGVSILNDCKYGHDIHDGIIKLSLLRSPTHPDPTADQGEIPFIYSIYPHKGTIVDADTVRLAYDLNYPMTAEKVYTGGGKLPESYSFVSFDRDNVVCETIKESEDGNDCIVRFYETKNQKCSVKVKFGFTPKEVCLCDLMENEIEKLPIKSNAVNVDVNSFEILTLKVK